MTTHIRMSSGKQQCSDSVAELVEVGDGAYGGESSRPALQKQSRMLAKVWFVIACLTFPTLAFVSGAYRIPIIYISGIHNQRRSSEQHRRGHGDDLSKDKYLGGLLATGFNEESCRSRFESTIYRKPSPHKPSPYLVQRLRQYEDLHRRCAPHTAAYNKTLMLLKKSEGDSSVTPLPPAECKYLVWTSYNGLGNHILTLASAFLYSLLTGRVMLVDRGKDLTALFCEPFPDATWLVPTNFPVDFQVFESKNNQSYGNMLRYGKISIASSGVVTGPPLPFIYVHMTYRYDNNDKRFFCEPDQEFLVRMPWMVLKADNYFVPALFLNRMFEPELSRLFPDKETVFHHMSRYLFHPSDTVWGMITRYYQSYLSMGREKLGIQIRIFNKDESPLDLVADQVINCTLREGLLPPVALDRPIVSANLNNSKVVLIASLHSQFSDQIRNMYWEHPNKGGAVVSVHQPSHEEWQQTGSENHDLKAWAEIYLLSFADVLVTSTGSTFGYIAQGLAGIRPWILVRPYGGKMPEPACVRETSMDPCFHSPPWYDCKSCKSFSDPGKEISYVTHCRDVPDGIKLVGRTD